MIERCGVEESCSSHDIQEAERESVCIKSQEQGGSELLPPATPHLSLLPLSSPFKLSIQKWMSFIFIISLFNHFTTENFYIVCHMNT